MKNNEFVRRLCVTLPVWLGWGAACSSVSWVCALVFDVGHGLSGCAAMSLGILTWSLVCGAVAATEAYEEHVDCTGWADALRLALRIRAAATLVGALLMTLGLGVPLLAGFNFMILPDFWAGMLSVNVGQGISKVLWGAMEQGDRDFGVIYLTTLVQGAWVIGSIVGLTGVIYGVRKVHRKGIVMAGG
jgi:hypothetical protein